jgi:hypothetical protein
MANQSPPPITVAQAIDAIRSNHEARISWIQQTAAVLTMLESGQTTIDRARGVIKDLLSEKP